MPKSKRSKVVPLTKVKKRPKEKKDKLLDEIREAASKFKYIFLLSIENERNNFIQVVRQRLRPSRLICAKNKVMQHALGMTPSAECEDNIHKLAAMITGQCGLLFSDKTPSDVQSVLAEYRPADFARSGAKATETVTLPRGVDALAHLPHSIEHHLRQLGMPTQLQNGQIHLHGDHTVCKEGQELTADAAQVLKLMDMKQAQFTMAVEAHWQKGGKFKDYTELND
mmetsp:Transcript_9841/g.26713  ORF Transcript_9841/g.26713 Transcript_9841/m.26713 type:complete len:225 (-) Transcript_9841:122-796(-)